MQKSQRIVARAVGAWIVVATAAGAAAQSGRGGPAPPVEIVAPTPAPPSPTFGLEPGMPSQQGGSREQEFYPGGVKSRHEPAFFPGASTVVGRTGGPPAATGVRVGLSGWTAPAVPFDISENGGGVAFGLTVRWDEPIAAPPVPPEPGGGR